MKNVYLLHGLDDNNNTSIFGNICLGGVKWYPEITKLMPLYRIINSADFISQNGNPKYVTITENLVTFSSYNLYHIGYIVERSKL